MADERSAVIKIGDTEYELLLTTKATKEIAKKYGGLSNLGDKLINSENYEEAISEIVWLIVTLANQPILIYNFKNKDKKKELLTEDEVELLTTPNNPIPNQNILYRRSQLLYHQQVQHEPWWCQNGCC